MTMICEHHRLKAEHDYVELDVHNLEIADQTEDEGKKNFEELSA
jgi:hypothetical protein